MINEDELRKAFEHWWRTRGTNSHYHKMIAREAFTQAANDGYRKGLEDAVHACLNQHYAKTINNQEYPSAWHDGADACAAEIRKRMK